MSDSLSLTFHALADPTRRRMLAMLAEGERTVSDLAAPFEMTFAGIAKHLKVLQAAGLVVRSREAQYRPARLDPAPLAAASEWIATHEKLWIESFDSLDRLLAVLQQPSVPPSGDIRPDERK